MNNLHNFIVHLRIVSMIQSTKGFHCSNFQVFIGIVSSSPPFLNGQSNCQILMYILSVLSIFPRTFVIHQKVQLDLIALLTSLSKESISPPYSSEFYPIVSIKSPYCHMIYFYIFEKYIYMVCSILKAPESHIFKSLFAQ